MAKKQALKGLFVDVLEEADKLKTSLSGVKKELSDISKIEKEKLNIIDTNTVKGVKELEEVLKRLNEVKESHVKISKIEQKLKQEESKVTQQLKASTDEEVKAKLRYNAVVSEQRKQLKNLVELERAEIGSINELRAKVKILTAERNALNTETKEGQERLKEINEELNKNNELIRENVDLATKQKMNVGNYRQDIEEAIGTLSQNNQVLGILANGYANLTNVLGRAKDTFDNLKTEFNLVKEGLMANTIAVNSNTIATNRNTLATEENTLITETNTVATATNTSWLQRHYQALLLNTKAIWRMVFSARALKIALAATGIGLLVVALTGLVGMFSQGISGSLRMEKTLKALGAGIRNVFSGLTGIVVGFVSKFSLIGESISLSIDQAVLSFKKLTMSSEDYYKKLAELNERQEKLDVAQEEANLRLRDGIDQLTKTVEVSTKASEGAIIALQRRLDSLNLSVSIAKLQRDFQTLGELAEDDTVSFTTRMKLYEQAEKKRGKLVAESMKKTVLDYQAGLASIVSEFQESEKMLTSKQTELMNRAKTLSKLNVLGMSETGLRNVTKEIESLTKAFTDYLGTADEMSLEKDFYSISEDKVAELVGFYNEVIAKDQEMREMLISSNERRRKAIQDEYEIEYDVRENFVLRLKDMYLQQASDERNTYDLRLKALDQFRYGAEIALQQQIDSFNKFSKEMEKSQKIEFGLLGIETGVNGVQVEMKKLNDEFKLFVNGVELNQDVFQGDFLKGLTGENAEKNLTFLRYVADLLTDVNTANFQLKQSNYDLAKSYLEVNDAINTSNKQLELQKKQLEQAKLLNSEENLAFMNEVEFNKYKQKQRDIEVKQAIEQAEMEVQIALNKSGLKSKELEMEREIFEERKRITEEELKLAIIGEQDAQQKLLLEEKLKAVQEQRFENTQKYKQGQDDILQAETDLATKRVNLEKSKNEEILNERDKYFVELKKRADMLRDIADGLDKIEEAYHERKMRRLDREYERSKAHEQRLIEAKKMGSDQANESLAMEIAKQEKILAKKEKLEQRKRRLEFVTAGIKAYASNLEKGITNPLAKTFTDVTLLAQTLKSLPLFWEGTEHVGKSLGKQHLNDKRDNYIVRVDKDERIMTKDQNNKLGNLSNDELADVGMKWNAGLLADVTKLNFKPVESKLVPYQVQKVDNSEYYLKEIKQELRELPNRMPLQSFEYDQVNKMAVDVVKLGNTTTRTRSRIRK